MKSKKLILYIDVNHVDGFFFQVGVYCTSMLDSRLYFPFDVTTLTICQYEKYVNPVKESFQC